MIFFIKIYFSANLQTIYIDKMKINIYPDNFKH